MSDNEIIDDLIEDLKKCPLATVSELGLDHSKCSFSTGIDHSLTAGQGHLDEHGFWQIPCPECAVRVEDKINARRAQPG